MTRSRYLAPCARDVELSERQKRVLAFVRKALAQGRPFPTNREISIHMGWKPNSSGASDCLSRLQWRGYIKMGTGTRSVAEPASGEGVNS